MTGVEGSNRCEVFEGGRRNNKIVSTDHPSGGFELGPNSGVDACCLVCVWEALDDSKCHLNIRLARKATCAGGAFDAMP